MATLRDLLKEKVMRANDESHYDYLIDAWSRVMGNWPKDPDEAGQATLLYAVLLAFLYKGQTNYPDGESNASLLRLLDRCRHTDAEDDSEWEEIIKELTRIPGVRLARASVLLHCMFPDSFPIVDVNAAKALCNWRDGWPERVSRPNCKPEEMTASAAGYLEYRRVLLDLVKASRRTPGREMDLRQVELALYVSRARVAKEAITGLS